MRRGPQPVPPEEIERRKAYMAPLMLYLRVHEISGAWLAREVSAWAQANNLPVVGSPQVWLSNMRRGRAVIPPWMIERCCAVIGKPVSEIMGAKWVKRFGADGRGGRENAPVGQPRQQKPWSRSRRPGESTQDNQDNRDNQAA